MAFYAEVAGDSSVIRVLVSDTLAYLTNLFGGTWSLTSPTTPTEQGAGPGLYDVDISPEHFLHQWVQPDSPADGYPKGQWVWNNGPWRSNHASNTATPGGADWRQYLEEWTQWTNPNGPNGPYYVGDKVTQATKHWINTVDGNTATPSAPSSGWDEVLESTAPTKGKP